MTITSEVLDAIKKRLIQLDHEAAVLREAYSILGQSSITVKPSTQYVNQVEFGRRKRGRPKGSKTKKTEKRYYDLTGRELDLPPIKPLKEHHKIGKTRMAQGKIKTAEDWAGVFSSWGLSFRPLDMAKAYKISLSTVHRAMRKVAEAKIGKFKTLSKGSYQFQPSKKIQMASDDSMD